LRERFGRRVRKSAHPHAATAIGLAIAASGSSRQQIHDRFTRNFGVWREWETGRSIAFDPIFAKDTPLPGPSDPPLVHVRRYRPIHNIGHFRYLECSSIGSDGRPAGDVTPWDAIQFPLDPALASRDDLGGQRVTLWPEGTEQIIEEQYACDANGMIEVTICNHSAGYQRRFQLRGSSV
jgi:molecular chaperone DnaK (HSP70)